MSYIPEKNGIPSVREFCSRVESMKFTKKEFLSSVQNVNFKVRFSTKKNGRSDNSPWHESFL